MKTQDFAAGIIIAGIVLGFLIVLGAPLLGRQAEPIAAQAAVTLFIGLASATAGWLFGRSDKEGTVAKLKTQNVEMGRLLALDAAEKTDLRRQVATLEAANADYALMAKGRE